MLDSGLEEDFKWSQPVYTIEGKNIVSIGATKNYTGIWFFQGGLLSDPNNVLVNAQEGKTKAMRQIRFNDEKEIDQKLLKSYIKEAIKNQQEGKVIKAGKNKNLIIPAYLKEAFNQDLTLKNAFDELNLSKKRDFAEYIETAKQESTKNRRLQKIIPMIMAGIGLNDRYK
jgi:uncharacterized protein YdeI (YjbR/CyaY-like superfamily)